ncbi:Cysteinyl-tRNA synthetase, partial [hydrothermal vent metagenome]
EMLKWQKNSTSNTQSSSADVENIEKAIAKRLQALTDKNWAEADAIRDELALEGIKLADSKDHETGERVTKWELKQ